jgi:hypothetical protein
MRTMTTTKSPAPIASRYVAAGLWEKGWSLSEIRDALGFSNVGAVCNAIKLVFGNLAPSRRPDYDR